MTFSADKKGSLRRLTGTFKDVAGALVDPTAVSLRITKPSGTQVTETYNPGNVVRNSIGSFRCDVNLDERGEWHYVWIGTGTGQAAEHGVFIAEGKA